MINKMASKFPLLHDKNILLYYLYSAIYGLYPINAVVALYFIFRGLSFSQIGIVFTIFSISSFIFEIPTGYLGDKFGRKNSIIWGLLTLTATAYVWTLAQNYIHFAILAAIWMLGFALISGSFEAYIFDHLSRNNETKNYDNIIGKSTMLFFYFGSIGSILGTFLYSVNHNLPYYLLSLTFFTSSLIVMMMDNDHKDRKSIGGENLKVLSGISQIAASKNLIWVTMFISLFFGYYHFFINSVNSPYILSLNIFDIKFLGLFMAIIGIIQGTISGKFGKIRARFSDTQIIIILCLIHIVTMLTMGSFAGYIGLLGILIFMQIEPFETILLNSFGQKFMESATRATTISSIKFIGAIVASAIGYGVGILVDRVGINQSFIWVALGISLISVLLFSYKYIHRITL